MNKTLKKIAIAHDWFHSKNEIFKIIAGYFFRIGATPLTANPNFKYIQVRLPSDLAIDKKETILNSFSSLIN